MATAHGIVMIEKTPHPYSITARVTQKGNDHLYLNGKVAGTFPTTFKPIIEAIKLISPYMDINFDSPDIRLTLDIPFNYPLAGNSYGLAAGMAILAGARKRIIPSTYCYTGVVEATGRISEVAFIPEKRRGAKGFGFEKFFLPHNQVDLFSTYIAQCPCRTLADAYGITFWKE